MCFLFKNILICLGKWLKVFNFLKVHPGVLEFGKYGIDHIFVTFIYQINLLFSFLFYWLSQECTKWKHSFINVMKLRLKIVHFNLNLGQHSICFSTNMNILNNLQDRSITPTVKKCGGGSYLLTIMGTGSARMKTPSRAHRPPISWEKQILI